MYLYSVGTALSNLCTYRRMTEVPILIDFFYIRQAKQLNKECIIIIIMDSAIRAWVFKPIKPKKRSQTQKPKKKHDVMKKLNYNFYEDFKHFVQSVEKIMHAATLIAFPNCH